jgi:hypothetical protein
MDLRSRVPTSKLTVPVFVPVLIVPSHRRSASSQGDGTGTSFPGGPHDDNRVLVRWLSGPSSTPIFWVTRN